MQIKDFTTQRLDVRSWRTVLQSAARRAALEQDLALILTPNVLAPLPAPLHMPRGTSQISDWVRAREAESDVYSVSDLRTGLLLGLLILAQDGTKNIHLGYMLADAAWGKGYATEVVSGLIEAAPQGQGLCFVAGVDVSNPASISVLLKAGFEVSQKTSTPQTRYYFRAVP